MGTDCSTEAGILDVVGQTAFRASEAAPLATFIATLVAAILAVVVLSWLPLHYKYLTERLRQRAQFGGGP